MLSIRQIRNITKTYRNFRRYEQIVGVFLKHGFTDVAQAMRLEGVVELIRSRIPRRHAERAEPLSRPERVRRALEELGPTFVKLGQILSTRPDLIPYEYIQELEKLQDQVPPFPYDDVAAVVEAELGAPPEDYFATFVREPLAAASIGQVHRASLRTGEEVVVKVRRPRIMESVHADLEIMLYLATLMERYVEDMRVQRPTLIVQEFARSLEKELNFKTEAIHARLFAIQCADAPEVKVPKVFAATEQVLVLEYIDGIKVTRRQELVEAGMDPRAIAERGATALVRQIFVHGFFHADPHPGNIMVLRDGRVCFLDFGMMGRITLREREDFADFIMRLIKRDERKLVHAMMHMTYYDAEPEKAELEREFFELVHEHLYRPVKDLEVGKLLNDLLRLLTRHRLRMRPDIFMMLKALITIERVGHELDPDMEIIPFVEPHISRIQLSRYNPLKLIREFLDPIVDVMHTMEGLPDDIQTLVKHLKESKLRIDLEAPGLKPLVNTLDRMTNRLVWALVVAALIIGSAVIVHSRIPPLWNGVPALGVVSFGVAAVLGLSLIWIVASRGRL